MSFCQFLIPKFGFRKRFFHCIISRSWFFLCLIGIYIYLNLEVIPKKFAFFKDVGVSSPVGWVTYDAGSQIPKLLLQLPNENEVGGGGERARQIL